MCSEMLIQSLASQLKYIGSAITDDRMLEYFYHQILLNIWFSLCFRDTQWFHTSTPKTYSALSCECSTVELAS